MELKKQIERPLTMFFERVWTIPTVWEIESKCIAVDGPPSRKMLVQKISFLLSVEPFVF